MDRPISQDRDADAVRHLVALGYVDPAEVAAREAAQRRALKEKLQHAIELYEQGLEQETLALLESLVEEDSDWITPHQRLAEIHSRAGRWPEAQVELDWLTHRGVESPRLALMAGSLALGRRDMPAALELAEYAQFAEPTLPGVQALAGTVLLRLRRFEPAETAFRRTLEQSPCDARALDGLAAIALAHGEFEQAADLALQALEQDMRSWRAHVHLGVALMHLGRTEQAIQALETAARIEPARTAPLYWLRKTKVTPPRPAPEA